jgi:undecaprenyl diphosphate synthase
MRAGADVVQSSAGLHVAIIMDGNGRWATARGLPRTEGHRAGAEAVSRAVEAAPGLGIGTLTLFAFSHDNWHRPDREVTGLMRVFEDFFRLQAKSLAVRGVRVSVLGRRDRLPLPLLAAVDFAEAATRDGHALHLRLAIDYSGRDAILRAAGRMSQVPTPHPETFSRWLADGASVPDVDLLIRTGGQQRLSNCPLWEIAYAELFFTDCLWPDFDADALEAAIREFHSRERRFGRIKETVMT